MRKKNFTGKDRVEMEDKGQMNIFDMIESGANIDDVVDQADQEIKKQKSKIKYTNDSPIGLRTDGTNIDIEEALKDETYDQEFLDMVQDNVSTTELKDILQEETELNIDTELAEALADHIAPSEMNAMLNEDDAELKEVLQKGFDQEDVKEIKEDVEYEHYTLDDFAGSSPDFDDRFIAFDTSLPTSDPKFVTAAYRSDYESIADFKMDFSGNGGLNEHLIIAFPLKADAEPEKVISMYEKKLASSVKADNKSADEEAKRIAELEASGDILEEESSDETEKKQKRGRRPKR